MKRLTVLVLGLVLIPISGFARECTVMIGNSQMRDLCDGLSRIGQGDFMCLWKGSTYVSDYAQGSVFNDLTLRYNYCDKQASEAEHVVLQLSNRENQSESEIADLATQAISNLKSRYPNAGDYQLMTLIGGPNGQRCPVRDDMNNISQCITLEGTCYVRESQVYAMGRWFGLEVAAGPNFDVTVYRAETADCLDYRDGLGHLTRPGERHVALRALDTGLILTAPQDDGDEGPIDDEPPPADSCPVTPLPNQTYYNACYNYYNYSKPFNSQEKQVIKACQAACEAGAPPPPPPEDEEPPPDDTGGTCPYTDNGTDTSFHQCYVHYGYSKPFNSQEKIVIKACEAACEGMSSPPSYEEPPVDDTLPPDDEGVPTSCPFTPDPNATLWHQCYVSLGFSKPFSGAQRTEIKQCQALCE